MSKSHLSPQAAEVTRTFVQGGFLAAVAVVSVITAATLVYVWFFT